MAASRQRSSSRRMPASFTRARSRRQRSARGRAAPSRRAESSSLAPPIASRSQGIAVHPASKWRTPLGEVPVAPVAHAELAQAPGVVVDPRPFAGEHSLEMHLIMLQAMLPAPFEIVPILVGDADPHDRRRGACAGSGADRRRSSRSLPTCRIFSIREAPSRSTTDTVQAHRDARRRRARWPPRLRLLTDQGRARDRRRARHARERPASGDIGGCWRGRLAGRRLRRLRARIRGLGAACREPIASVCFPPAWPPSAYATRTGGKAPPLSLDDLSPTLSAWRATFVTLTENERLRGCIGSLEPRRPLIEDAVANTAQAAFADPRFPPLKESELAGLRLDVSILSHPRPIPPNSESELAAALEPDRDGLILSAGKRRALFLPSVWRHLPDARAFVRHLMAKAGFESNRWPEGLEARRFRVESFGAPWRQIDAEATSAARSTTQGGPTLRHDATVFSVRRQRLQPSTTSENGAVKKSVQTNLIGCAESPCPQ